MHAFHSSAETVFESTLVDDADLAELALKIDAMEARGTTDLAGGMQLGLQQVAAHMNPDGINRVVLLGDGVPNDPSRVIPLAQQYGNANIPIAPIALGLSPVAIPLLPSPPLSPLPLPPPPSCSLFFLPSLPPFFSSPLSPSLPLSLPPCLYLSPSSSLFFSTSLPFPSHHLFFLFLPFFIKITIVVVIWCRWRWGSSKLRKSQGNPSTDSSRNPSTRAGMPATTSTRSTGISSASTPISGATPTTKG